MTVSVGRDLDGRIVVDADGPLNVDEARLLQERIDEAVTLAEGGAVGVAATEISANDEDQNQDQDELIECPDCGQSCASERGRSIHVAKSDACGTGDDPDGDESGQQDPDEAESEDADRENGASIGPQRSEQHEKSVRRRMQAVDELNEQGISVADVEEAAVNAGNCYEVGRSIGVSRPQAEIWLKQLGIYNAINLDQTKNAKELVDQVAERLSKIPDPA